MDFNKIKLIFHTVKYLRFKQIAYRLINNVRKRFSNKEYNQQLKSNVEPIQWSNTIEKFTSYSGNLEFCFLNIRHKFEGKINWNYDDYGKLWTYNLNYFDFLNQSAIKQSEALILMKDYVERTEELKDGLEPYPISLRCINWIKYLSKKKIQDEAINKSLYNQYLRLLDNLEYHILGNHLLENGFSLLFGAYYFKDDVLYLKAKNIIEEELEEQILKDGAHFELSPMYHQIILDRVLDCIQLIKLNSWKNDDLLNLLKESSSKMLSWLDNVTFKNGDIPMVNDSAFQIAPSSEELLDYGTSLGINRKDIKLTDSGYRMFKNQKYELFMDMGGVKASYQPGHVHSDTFNFILYKNNRPVFVDTGVSTYKKDDIRQKERATASHNTVMLGEIDQTEVWGGFRVARRAKVFDLQTGFNFLSAKHSGYKKNGYVHSRSFEWSENEISIKDSLSKSSRNNAKAFFHFHSSINLSQIDNNTILIDSLGVVINFEKASKIFIDEYKLSKGFNKSVLAYKIVVTFDHYLKTNINFK
ncbi:heparinase II/III family protein [Flavobacteriaceae bacterium]|nr:heparinase II/III family protein [Flavobacteriaceae bacterium]